MESFFALHGIDSCEEHVKRTVRHISRGNVDISTGASQLYALKEIIVKDLRDIKFLHVAHDRAAYVDARELFGEAVGSAFPSAQRDIGEAYNCIGVECSTAAVFHLMRASEFTLRALARDRQVSFKEKPLEEKEWAQILDKLESEVKRLRESPRAMWSGSDRKDEQIRFYAEVTQELRGFNDAWRRHVSHADGNAFYTPEEAIEILKHVRTFTQKLATRISEGEVTLEYWT